LILPDAAMDRGLGIIEGLLMSLLFGPETTCKVEIFFLIGLYFGLGESAIFTTVYLSLIASS